MYASWQSTGRRAIARSAYPSNLRGHPLFVSSSEKPFSRARNVNLLLRMSNGTYFIIVDTDMLITQSALDHVRVP